jgi:hypothetical protein
LKNEIKQKKTLTKEPRHKIRKKEKKNKDDELKKIIIYDKL